MSRGVRLRRNAAKPLLPLLLAVAGLMSGAPGEASWPNPAAGATATSPPPVGPSPSSEGEESSASVEAPPDPREIERLRGEVESLRSRLEGRKEAVDDASAEARRLDLLVELLGRERELAEAELRRASAEARTVHTQMVRGEAARRELVDQLGRRLAGLYRLGSGGILRLLVAPANGDRMAVARTLALLARRDRRLLRDLEEQTAALARQAENLAVLESRVAALARGRTEREEKLREARNRQSLVATELRRVQERDSRRLAELEESTRRLERLLELIEKSRRSPSLAGEDLRRYRGALGWPISGGVRIRFGRQKHPRYDAWVMNNGIEIDAGVGATVAAVLPGRVVYARWLKGYGNMVILDHGARLLTLYGHLGAVSVTEGSNVRMGEPVGTTSSPGEEAVPTVYFEVRDGGTAVDPLGWLRPVGEKKPS